MTIIVFILVLVALIVVHEFGHFLVAKWSGMRVDEFGIGYPPKLWGIRRGETEYTINALPFGGFVKIFGEDPEPGVTPSPRAFTARPRPLQALVLLAGISMNLLFAWVLISATLFMGTPRALGPEQVALAPDAVLAIAAVLPGSAAQEAGLLPGETIFQVQGEEQLYRGADPDEFSTFISAQGEGAVLTLQVKGQNGVVRTITATPRAGSVTSDPLKSVLGVSVAPVGTIALSWWQAPIEGAVLTWEVTKETAIALVKFFGSIFTFTADLSQVAGPVGIAGAVGAASDSGAAALLTITAIISINLALINLLPIPALDGGRLLFVIIESIIRRPLNPAIANAVNAVGFGLLILLMVVVTAHDVLKLVG